MVNNVASTLLSCVDSELPVFASDVSYDIEESPKVQEIFGKIQSLMNIKVPRHLIRPISSRFIQMLDVATRLIECVDVLTVYYYGFLTEDERGNELIQ
ncbi:hypothetical protein DPMN_017039 [Dreissena polymorpha]|uniref:Uncharacterized protein n=1 Tax=Dreissena polymorpha TaxID=45954 RepID=A0A9D4S530_DREPO|nr:hypothetical protein DPMN_017039 [Dreissena polymorpha]